MPSALFGQRQLFDSDEYEVVHRVFLCFQILSDPTLYVEEEAYFNRQQRYLKLHTKNVTLADYVVLEEVSEYRPAESHQNM